MTKENNHESLTAALDALIPKDLDDIIRKNREYVSLRLTNEEDLQPLYSDISPDESKLMQHWCLVTLTIHGIPEVLLVGETKQHVMRVTSTVRQIDRSQGLLITNSGSLYKLGLPVLGEPPFTHLAALCSTLHKWGMGVALGVATFYY